MPDARYFADPTARALVLPGVAADRHYTFSVRAYRKVAENVDASGVIYSTVATSSAYQPLTAPAFLGDLQGTIQGRGSLLVVQNLEAIASDAVLSTTEKPALIVEYNNISSRYTAIMAKSAGITPAVTAITSARTAATSAYTALNVYLAGLTPAWNDPSQHTPIVPATFQAAFAAMYANLADLEATVARTSVYNDNTPLDILRPTESSSDETSVIIGPGMTEVLCDASGNPKSGQLNPRQISFALIKGTSDQTANASWSYAVLEGDLAGSIGLHTGDFNLTTAGTNGVIEIRAQVGSLPVRKFQHQVRRVLDHPPVTVAGTVDNELISGSVDVSATWEQLGGNLSVTVGSGGTVSLAFNYTFWPESAHAAGHMRTQFYNYNGSSWVAIGSSTISTKATQLAPVGKKPGNGSATYTHTGLTPASVQQYRVYGQTVDTGRDYIVEGDASATA